MVIRTAIATDTIALIDLYRTLNPDDLPPPCDEFEKQLKNINASSDNSVFILEIDNILVATCYLNVIPNLTRNLSPYGIIENVVTKESHRRQGFATTVVRHALNVAWDKGCYKVMLQTGSKNPGKLLFYEKCGFLSGKKTSFVAIRPTEFYTKS